MKKKNKNLNNFYYLKIIYTRTEKKFIKKKLKRKRKKIINKKI